MPTNIINPVAAPTLPGTTSTINQGSITIPGSTAATATGTAMQLGNTVYNQLPNYSSSLSNIGANIGSETAGQLPADVVRQIQQAAAERGVATGTSGSQNNNAAYLQALDLNSLALTNTGEQNLESILPTLPGAAISQNPGFYATPGQYLNASEAGAELQNKIGQQNQAQANNQQGLALAKQGLAAGLGSSPAGSFTLPGDNSASEEAAWWNTPDYGAPVVYSAAGGAGGAAPGATGSSTDQLLAELNSAINGGIGGGASPWTPNQSPAPEDEQSNPDIG